MTVDWSEHALALEIRDHGATLAAMPATASSACANACGSTAASSRRPATGGWRVRATLRRSRLSLRVSIRLLIADDQALVRAGFRMILDAEDDLEVVGEAATGSTPSSRRAA